MIQGLPAGVRRRAFDAFCREIMQAPTLANRRLIKTWILFNGTSKSPVADPADDAMPAARIRMMGGDVARRASQGNPGEIATLITESNPTILIELWTPGTDQGDLHDFHDLIEDVLFPRGQADRSAIQGRLNAAGIMDWRFTRDIAPTDLASFGESYVAGSGEIQLTLIFSN